MISGRIKVSIAQINPIVGDIIGNSEKIISAWKLASAEGAELALFPELCVIGYPPKDLVLSPDFREKCMTAVQEITKKTSGGAALIIGCLWEVDNKIHNSAILIDDGKIQHIQHKNRLPNYGVFDEKRIFSAGDAPQAINWRGHKIGILICEDVWDISLSETLGKKAVEAVFVLNASPFEIGKLEQRKKIVSTAAKAANVPVYYANMVGGQDDIVFDGGSFVADANGKIFFEFPQFEEKIAFSSELRTTNYDVQEQQIWSAMKLGLADYVRKNGFKSVVLGLSGGIDSAVSAAVAVDALGAENVLGVLLPSPYNSEGSITDALETAKLLGIKTKAIPLVEAMKSFSSILSPEIGNGEWMENPSIGGNLQARIRGVILMAISNSQGHLLLSTGNKSEIAVGYSTLYGDSCGAYNVLKDAYKTTVYRLANWRNSQSPAIPKNSIQKPPSAELKPNQRDDDQLPPYDILDVILELHIEERLGEREIIEKGFAPEIVKKIIHLVRISEYKRQQSCAGVKISKMSFGGDRRFPITNKF